MITVLWAAVVALRLILPEGSGTSAKFNGLAYWVSVAFETIGILIAVAWLVRKRKTEYIMPAIAIIVGLHFVGLWPAFSDPKALWIAAGFCIVGGLAIAVPAAGAAALRRTITGFGCSAVLWISSAVSILRDVS
jgi:hypothetical protein